MSCESHSHNDLTPFLRHADGRAMLVSRFISGETIGPGLLRAILHHVEMSAGRLAQGTVKRMIQISYTATVTDVSVRVTGR